MNGFSTIRNISLEHPETWIERVFLTIDIDWAHDDVLAETIDIVEKQNMPVTWFVTHDTPLLARLRANPLFELGIHPNFNPLLQGQSKLGWTVDDVLTEILQIVPEAVSVRSHSMTQSSRILDAFAAHGLQFECNHFMPWHTEIELKPWQHWQKLIRVPYFWEDDIYVLEKKEVSPQVLLNRSGLKVFDFHPIHIVLNTADLGTYEASRPVHDQLEALKTYRSKTPGTANYLQDLIEAVRCSERLLLQGVADR